MWRHRALRANQRGTEAMMTVKERILAAMNWEEPDQIPLTVFEMLFPRSEAERLLRDSGVGLVYRPPGHIVEHRQVEIESRQYWQDGELRVRRTIHTPVGDIWQTLVPDKSDYEPNDWIKEYFIKGPEDYKVLEFYLRDAVFHDNLVHLREAVRRMGDDGLVYVRIAKAPLQSMLYELMGFERFSIDYFERRDLFDSLHALLVDRYEDLYDLAAAAPVEIVALGDNISSDVVGGERFRTYLMPVYKRIMQKLSGTGKKLAVHMDGRLAGLTDDIAQAEFDIMEAFTPPPMGDVSLKTAREAWPRKAQWINFTSCIHIERPEVIEAHTRQLIEEAGGKAGFAIGITENAPLEPLEKSLKIIGDVIRDYG